jgi:hypothetical protein
MPDRTMIPEPIPITLKTTCTTVNVDVAACPLGFGLIALIELHQHAGVLAEHANGERVIRPERRLVDRERALVETLGLTIVSLTCNHPGRRGEGVADEHMRWPEGVLHQVRQAAVEEFGPAEVSLHPGRVRKIAQEAHDTKILGPESALEDGERLLEERLRFVVVSPLDGLLRAHPEREGGLELVESGLSRHVVARSSVGHELDGRS